MKQYFALLVLFLAATLPLRAQASPSLVIDLDNARVILAEKAFHPWHPASLTKMMTALVVFRAIESGKITLEQPVVVSRNATRVPPSRMGYRAGTAISMEDALELLLIKSANDISVAIAETVAGSVDGFARLMNAEARRLGMTGSNFVNPHGLHDARQVVTARDLALLVLELHRNHQRYAHLFGTPRVLAPVRRKDGKRVMREFLSWNRLLERYRGADGFKTGYVCASGYNFAAAASRGGRRISAIVLGRDSTDERVIDAARLLTDAFQRPVDAGTPLADLRPEGVVPSQPANMRPRLCTEKGREALKAKGPPPRMADSPWLQPRQNIGSPMEVALLGTFPAVTVPKPRPNYTPPAPIDGVVASNPSRIPLPAFRPSTVN